MIQVAENGLGQPQFTFINPANTKWYNPNVEKYDFDLNKVEGSCSRRPASSSKAARSRARTASR